MKIYLADIVKETYTNASGNELFVLLQDLLSKEGTIEISFLDTSPPSSSFLNSSFGRLIREKGLQNFMNKIKPKDFNTYPSSNAKAVCSRV